MCLNFEIDVEYFSCINMYRILVSGCHKFLSDRIASFQIEHEYTTRASSLELLTLPLYRLTKCKRSFVFRGLTFWNKLPINIRNIPNNPRTFKNKLNKFLLDRI